MASIEPKKRVSRPALFVAASLCAAIGIIVVVFAGAATALIGDINHDGKVDVFDLSLLLSKWNTADLASDLNASGKVDVFDLSLLLSHWGATAPTPSPTVSNSPTPVGGVSAATPCVGGAAPAQWKHVVVLMFENQTYNNVIGTQSPFITNLANKCATYTNWHDANYRVNGVTDGSYVSKPNYATLFSGVPPSVHGLRDDNFSSTSSVDNIFNRLYTSGKPAKSYQPGGPGPPHPDAGGAYGVSKVNLGRNASRIAAAALLVDYVLTVAVSVAASVENFTSAFPSLLPYTVWICCGKWAA